MSDWRPLPAPDQLDRRKTLGIFGASLLVVGICATIAWFVDWSRHGAAVPPVAPARQSLNEAAIERAQARAARERAAWQDRSAARVHVPVDLTMQWFQADAAVAQDEKNRNEGAKP